MSDLKKNTTRKDRMHVCVCVHAWGVGEEGREGRKRHI